MPPLDPIIRSSAAVEIMLHGGTLKSFRILGDGPVLHLLERVGRNPRTFANLVQAGFPQGQLTKACTNFARTAETPVQRHAARRIQNGYFDDEELVEIFCRYYECDDWKLESSPLFFAKQDYGRFIESLVSPIDFASGLLEGGEGEEKWGDIFLRNPFNLGMEKAKSAVWGETCRKDHYWSKQSSYGDLRASLLFQHVVSSVNPAHFSKDIFFFNWERDFRVRLAASLKRFQEALERAVRRWQDERNREKRRARFTRGAYPSPDDTPLIEVKEAMAHLGLDLLSATLGDLRRSYRRLCKSAHPDQGGSDTSFRYLSACRDIAESWIRRNRLS